MFLRNTLLEHERLAVYGYHISNLFHVKTGLYAEYSSTQRKGYGMLRNDPHTDFAAIPGEQCLFQ